MLLSPAQLQTLSAICDTLLPSLEVAPDDDGYWQRAAHELNVAQRIVEDVARLPLERDRKNFTQLVSTLDSRLMNGLLNGKPTRFSDLSLHAREKFLYDWSTSRMALKRQGFQALKRLAALAYFSEVDEAGHNANWPTLHYPGPVSKPQPIAKPIKPLDPLSLVTHQSSLECEVVVIGSGAGGGVIASTLASAGKSVIVIERGGYFNEADFNQFESEQSRQLFWDGARLVTQDSAVSLLTGSCLGGGTTINWCASFRPPQRLRECWEQEHGLAGVAGADFDADIDAVCERLHVGKAESFINAQNEKLLRGAQALGYHVDTIARNVSECEHGEDCGYCTFGCVRGAKQSTLVTYLQDAADHGARFIVNAEAQRVLIENGRAVGVEVTLSRDDESWGRSLTPAPSKVPMKQAITVRAKAVVVAGGSIGSPALLLRSGLKNLNIGRHLQLHPTSFVFGVYAEPIEAWQGVPMSIVCDQFADLNDGYGFALEVPPMHTSVPAVAIPWTSGHAYKLRMAQLAHTAAFITLVKDRDGGRVTINKKGQPLIDYWLSGFDRAHLVRAMQEAARIHIAAGAREVYSAHTPPVAWQQGEPVESFIEELAHARYDPHRVLIGSAHQMGTCRMGRDAKESVADTRGEVHGIKGLWIGDASAFPTASGVNPMITIMALAQRTARYIKASL